MSYPGENWNVVPHSPPTISKFFPPRKLQAHVPAMSVHLFYIKTNWEEKYVTLLHSCFPDKNSCQKSYLITKKFEEEKRDFLHLEESIKNCSATMLILLCLGLIWNPFCSCCLQPWVTPTHPRTETDLDVALFLPVLEMTTSGNSYTFIS